MRPAPQRPPPARPRPLLHGRRADRAARPQPPAHRAHRLRPRRTADHAGAGSRPGGTHRRVRPARRWRAQSPPGCRLAGPGRQATLMAETPGPSGGLPRHAPVPNRPQPRKLRRSGADKMLAGVAGGMARYLNADVTLVRVIIAALVLFTGAGVALYVAAWLLIPEDGVDRRSPRRGSPAAGT